MQSPQEKTVEQVEKNIKVLIGMPQSQLIPVMNFFRFDGTAMQLLSHQQSGPVGLRPQTTPSLKSPPHEK